MKFLEKYRAKWSLFVVATLLAGCSTHHVAPVESRLVGQENAQILGYHVVNTGETLYSIAWSYGLDYRQLAGWNGIGHNYLIFPGQRLQLSGPRLSDRQKNDENAKNLAKNSSTNTPVSINKPVTETNPRTNQQVGSGDSVSRNSNNPSGSNSTNRSTHSANSSDSNSTASLDSRTNTWVGSTQVNWQWPALGSVILPYSSMPQGNKGLNIAGKKGEPVRAAADGMVVYAGGGLRGFGNLVIVKHNDEFLSAYAHNDTIRVKENDTVKAGQTIADIGDSGTDKVQLHFEIRYQGQPVDPLRYLPKR